jgi:hypothetical protein
LREKVRMRGFFRAIHPHPCPLPQAGEGSDSILTLSQSAKLLTFSLSERHQNWPRFRNSLCLGYSRLLKSLRSPFENLRANGEELEMIEYFPFMLSLPVLSEVEGSKAFPISFQQPR